MSDKLWRRSDIEAVARVRLSRLDMKIIAPARRLCVAGFVLVAASSALAEERAATLGATHPDIGTVQTRIQKYEHALGIIGTLTRSADKDIQCDGLCYFPNGVRGVVWMCGPGKTCNLYCTRNPPAGGCDPQ